MRSFFRKQLLLFSLLLSTLAVPAQMMVYDVSMDTLESWVRESPEAFRALHEKCMATDSSMAEAEYFLLYYGSAFLDSYAPYAERLAGRLMKDLLDAENYEEAVSTCEGLLREHPAYVRPYYYLGIAHDLLGDTVRAAVYFERFFGLLSIAYNSGTGGSTDSAFVVRSVDDEYLLLGELGYEVVEQALVNDENGIPFDVMTVRHPETGEEKTDLYFNIYQPYVLGMKKIFEGIEEDPNPKEKKKGKKRKKRERGKE